MNTNSASTSTSRTTPKADIFPTEPLTGLIRDNMHDATPDNTTVYGSGTTIAVKLHKTTILQHDTETNRTILNDGGYLTPVTTRRMNESLQALGIHAKVMTRQMRRYVTFDSGETLPFSEEPSDRQHIEFYVDEQGDYAPTKAEPAA